MVEGFKHTDAGLIPNDWNVSKLSEIAHFENGKAHEQFIDENGDFVVVNSKFISTEGEVVKYSNKNLSPLEKGSITIVMSDIPNGRALAKCYLVEKDNRFTLNQRIGCVQPNEDINNDYLFYKLNRNKYFLSFDSGSGQTNLRRSEILDCPVALPPTKAEQTAIATILNDADALITQLEKLIAKKRAIKQGAMQELLKAKEGWEENLLTEYVNYIHGKAHEKDISENGKYVVVNSKFISTEGKIVKYSNVNYCPAKQDDILTVLSDLPNGKALAKCFYVDEENKYAVNQRICIWRSKGTSQRFLFYLLNRNKYFLGLDDGISQTHILNHHIAKCRISVPKDIKKQISIAQILSNMDAEIEALEKKLDKYKMLKNGMMKNLLTGKIRLV